MAGNESRQGRGSAPGISPTPPTRHSRLPVARGATTKPNVLIAGILGGIAMYIWSTVAHVVLPLGQIGFSQMPNQTAVLSAHAGLQRRKGRPRLLFRGSIPKTRS